MDYIIVQAGGKGTRLEYLTKNKPKALVPIDNLPMLFHLFKKYPDKKFVIIADYHREVLHEYLTAFAKVDYQIVNATGIGTCSGVRQAINKIPEDKEFMLIWSDLILPEHFELPKEYEDECVPKNNYIGISKTFPCRWSYKDGTFIEESSYDCGVAGFFLLSSKKHLENVPQSGELVRWMSQNDIHFEEISLAGTREFGLIEEYKKIEQSKCRPFNRISIEGEFLIKEPIDAQGEILAKRERAWYKVALEKNNGILPKIYQIEPLKMEYIKGKNIYECELSYEEKKEILNKLVSSLKQIHEYGMIPANASSMKEAYYTKTINRLSKVQDLIPFAHQKVIVINGKKCRNVYFYLEELEKRIDQLQCSMFHFIHGDCTFSNMMLRQDGSPVLIDPRGYFGFTELYGDIRYDWAKLYYSIVGNYDRFNLKDFCLDIREDEIILEIASNHWEDMESDFFAMTKTNSDEIRLLHAIIWLSLTTYAWQDYDSICGAFYNGLYYLQDVL